MHTGVVAVAFVLGVGTFAAWLAFMIRHERSERLALAGQSRERVTSHRRDTLAARRSSVTVAVPVVRPGAFCRVPGNIGRSKRGAVLICDEHSHGRPRWRQVEPLRAAS
jgi:hypothetical protein